MCVDVISTSYFRVLKYLTSVRSFQVIHAHCIVVHTGQRANHGIVTRVDVGKSIAHEYISASCFVTLQAIYVNFKRAHDPEPALCKVVSVGQSPGTVNLEILESMEIETVKHLLYHAWQGVWKMPTDGSVHVFAVLGIE